MRRTIALSLLLLFTSMLIAPLLAPDAEASLPPCCRRHGKHHCAMQLMLAQSGTPSGPPALEEKCPLWPKDGGAAHSATYKPETERCFFVAAVSRPARAAQSEVRGWRCFLGSHAMRGPPMPPA